MPGIISRHLEDANDGQAAGTNHWLSLSNEMVFSILRLLPQKDLVTISRINKKFRDLSRDEGLWRELTLDYQNIKENNQSCRDLLARCGKLSHLKITNKLFDNPPPSPIVYRDDSDNDDEQEQTNENANDEDFDDTAPLNIMSVVIEAEATLTSLHIETDWVSKWSPNALSQLGQMKQLQELQWGFDVKYSGLTHLAGLQNLTEIKIWFHKYEQVAMKTMKTFFSQFNKLQVVHVNDVSSDEMITNLASNNPSLRELSLYDYKAGSNEDESRILSDQSLLFLAENCPNLESISIPIYATKGVLEKLVTSCPKMRHIKIDGSLIEDDTFGKLGDHGMALENLQMNYAPNISIEGFKRLVSSARNLKRVAVWWPGNIMANELYTGKRVNKEEFYKLKAEYPKVDMFIYMFAN